MPAWYVRLCDAQSRAVWRGQVTEREATQFLIVFHAAALGEAMAGAGLREVVSGHVSRLTTREDA